MIWHVTLNGTPACTSTLVAADERLEPPVCGTRNRERAEEYARLLRERHPEAVIEVAAHGCPMRGE